VRATQGKDRLTQTVFYDLLRHGEPVGGNRYRGQTDDPLSERGWAQMWASMPDDPPWHQVVTSPLARCRSFAEALGQRLGVPVLQEPRFMEVRFGAWEGHTAAELEADDPGVLTRFYLDPVRNRPAGAEPLDRFTARVSEGWREWTGEERRRHTLVVAHAGVVRAVIAEILDVPLARLYRIQVANAGLTRISLAPQRPATLIFHGGCLAPGGEG
jgi:alpha-ribazole phosphatase/probable phosphoglycerate mutase